MYIVMSGEEKNRKVTNKQGEQWYLQTIRGDSISSKDTHWVN